MKRRRVRGGSWVIARPLYVRAADKGSDIPETRDKYVGFRTHLAVREPRV
jgi:formylglycine-generating enzyme required for sulfatase activity